MGLDSPRPTCNSKEPDIGLDIYGAMALCIMVGMFIQDICAELPQTFADEAKEIAQEAIRKGDWGNTINLEMPPIYDLICQRVQELQGKSYWPKEIPEKALNLIGLIVARLTKEGLIPLQ